MNIGTSLFLSEEDVNQNQSEINNENQVRRRRRFSEQSLREKTYQRLNRNHPTSTSISTPPSIEFQSDLRGFLDWPERSTKHFDEIPNLNHLIINTNSNQSFDYWNKN